MIGHKGVLKLFLLSLIGYFAQGSLYPQGSFISQTFLLIVLAISAFYFFNLMIVKRGTDLFYFSWTSLLVLNCIGFILTGNLSNSSHFGMFKGVLLNSLVFYPFYYFTWKGHLDSKTLIGYFLFILPVTILQYFFNSEQILSSRISDREDVVNNIAYSFVWLIPFVFLFKKQRILSIGVMFLLMSFIIQGAKRGALIAGGLGFIVFIYYQFKSFKSNGLLSYLITFVSIGILVYFVVYTFQTNEYLLSRIETIDEGSGRVRIFPRILNNWTNSNFLNLLFGHGFAASQDIVRTFAHNDWLELLSNFGLLGVSVYLCLFYSATRFLGNKTWTEDQKMLLLSVILMWFVVSLVSMGYTNVTNGYLRSILLAFLVGSVNSRYNKFL